MKVKAIQQLNDLCKILDKEAKKLSDLRNELVYQKDYSLANEIIRLESSVLDLHHTTIRHLDDLTYVPPKNDGNKYLHDNVD